MKGDCVDLRDFLVKHKLKEGDLIELLTKDKAVLAGFIIPSKEESILRLKLKNGYNYGARLSEIAGVKKIGEEKGRQASKAGSAF